MEKHPFPLYLPIAIWQINRLMTYLDGNQKGESTPQQVIRRRLEDHTVSLQAKLIDLSTKQPDLVASGIINKEVIITCYNQLEKDVFVYIIQGLKSSCLKTLLTTDDPIQNLELTFEYYAWCHLFYKVSPQNTTELESFHTLIP